MADELTKHEREIIEQALVDGDKIQRVETGVSAFDPLNPPSWRDSRSAVRAYQRRARFDRAKQKAGDRW